jgi:magnesium-transporting ATPase (P-type)
MNGNSVNDTSALKKVDIGITIADATNAARCVSGHNAHAARAQHPSAAPMRVQLLAQQCLC